MTGQELETVEAAIRHRNSEGRDLAVRAGSESRPAGREPREEPSFRARAHGPLGQGPAQLCASCSAAGRASVSEPCRVQGRASFRTATFRERFLNTAARLSGKLPSRKTKICKGPTPALSALEPRGLSTANTPFLALRWEAGAGPAGISPWPAGTVVSVVGPWRALAGHGGGEASNCSLHSWRPAPAPKAATWNSVALPAWQLPGKSHWPRAGWLPGEFH